MASLSEVALRANRSQQDRNPDRYEGLARPFAKNLSFDSVSSQKATKKLVQIAPFFLFHAPNPNLLVRKHFPDLLSYNSIVDMFRFIGSIPMDDQPVLS